jgi:oligopeptide/dipeptide ABC transporter ATP-binding protein
MELTDRDTLYKAPMHPYTHALMSAVPVPDPAKEARRQRILLVGDLPSPINPPSGCVFHTRCPKYREVLDDSERSRCRDEVPAFEEKRPGHFVHCHFPEVRTDLAVAEDAGVVGGSESSSPDGNRPPDSTAAGQQASRSTSDEEDEGRAPAPGDTALFTNPASPPDLEGPTR